MEEEVDRSHHLKVSVLAWKRRWTDLFISRLVRLHGRGGGQISSSLGYCASMEEDVDISHYLKVSELLWKRRWTDLFILRLASLHGRGGGQISSS
jgi:hypothetical protein